MLLSMTATELLPCRSEARKMEQKDLVMEGGVVGIGINLVGPTLHVHTDMHSNPSPLHAFSHGNGLTCHP